VNFLGFAWFCGIIDGDGYLAVLPLNNKNGKKYIIIYLSITLDIRDEFLLKHIQSTFNAGRISYFKDDKENRVRLTFKKTELLNIPIRFGAVRPEWPYRIFPAFNQYNIQFLVFNRRKQFIIAKYILDNNISFFDDRRSLTLYSGCRLTLFERSGEWASPTCNSLS
jgi:hypothetical protein